MDTYVILRRGGWKSAAELEEAAARSSQVGDEEMSEDIRWIRSYLLDTVLVRPDPEAAPA